jgi:protein FAM32A
MSGRGKLSFKGDKKSSKKKSSKSKHKLCSPEHSNAKTTDSKGRHSGDDELERQSEPPNHDSDEELTAAEKRSRKFKADQAKREMEKVVKLSHRERVEQFNEKLGQLTELNDIPRVSAAGNG